MKKILSKSLAVMAVSSLPMTAIATATVLISADTALAAGKAEGKGKSDKGGKPGDKGKPETTGKPESTGQSGDSAGKQASAMKGLNSLKRNINGLMNSSDPKVAGFRDYLMANEALVDAEDLLAIAQGEFDAVNANYTALELTGDPETDLADLQSQLGGLTAPDPETATQEEIDAYNELVASLSDAIITVEIVIQKGAELGDALQAVADAFEGTTEEDLLQAFVEAMHASGQTDFTLDDITDEMLALFQRHIDAYLN